MFSCVGYFLCIFDDQHNRGIRKVGYSTARHSQCVSSSTPNSAPTLAFRPPSRNPSPSPPPTPFNPVIPRLREESGGKRPLHHSGSRRPESIPRGGPLILSRVEGSSGGPRIANPPPRRHSCGGRNPSLLKAHPPPSRDPSTPFSHVIPAAESRNPSLEAARAGRPVPSPSDGRGLGWVQTGQIGNTRGHG